MPPGPAWTFRPVTSENEPDLAAALLDRLTHHVNILEMNGKSYRLRQSKARQNEPKPYTINSTSWPLRAKASGRPPTL